MRKYIVLLIMAFGFTSCENFLDVKPEGEVMGDALFETAEGCEDALYGVYCNLGVRELYGQVLSYYVPDILAPYYIMEGVSGVLSDLTQYSYSSESGVRKYFDDIWKKMYENISYTNNILSSLQGKEKTFRYYNFYKGEALALRAFMHFELCNGFVPAYREDTKDKPAIPYCLTYEPLVYPFLTLEKVYRKVIRDLKEAETLMQNEGDFMNDLVGASRPNQPGVPAFMTERQFHLNLYAVQGLLARIYLMKNDLDSAMIYADKVISSQKFRFADKTVLVKEFASKISESETLWGVRGQGEWEGNLNTYFNKASNEPREEVLLPLNGYYLSWGGEGGMPVDWGYQQIYQVPNHGTGEQDFRSTWFYKHTEPSVTYTHFYKIYNRDKTSIAKKGVNMIRLPEMYLIMIEGLIKKGQIQKAREYLDDYTFARGFVYLDNDVNFDMGLVNKEFRKEFIGEGRTWFNMKRQNLPVNSSVYHMMTTPGSDELYVWPIPEDEFEYREGGREGIYSPEITEKVESN